MNKITPEHIDSVIDDVRYDLPGSESTLTLCIIKLKNGTEIVGKSACCSIDIYDEFVGKQFARADAVRQIWPLEGYLLKERMLYQNGKREPETNEEKTEIEETPEATEKPGKITEITPVADVIEPEPKIA